MCSGSDRRKSRFGYLDCDKNVFEAANQPPSVVKDFAVADLNFRFWQRPGSFSAPQIFPLLFGSFFSARQSRQAFSACFPFVNDSRQVFSTRFLSSRCLVSNRRQFRDGGAFRNIVSCFLAGVCACASLQAALSVALIQGRMPSLGYKLQHHF